MVPVYNGYEYVVKLVGSLRRMLPQLDFPTSVIVVDDASTDPLLHAYYAMEDFFGWPEVRLLRLPENQGFCGRGQCRTQGRRAGMRRAVVQQRH